MNVVGVTLSGFVVQLTAQSCLNLYQQLELMEDTAVCWVEWGGLTEGAGVEEQEPLTPQALWGALLVELHPFVAQVRQQLQLLLAALFAAGQLAVLELGPSVLVLLLCLEEQKKKSKATLLKAMWALRKRGGSLYSISTSALYRGEWLASHPGHAVFRGKGTQ